MKRAMKVVKRNTLFFLLFTMIAAVMLCLTLFLSKATCFMALNPVHTPALALVFNMFTFLGDGTFVIALAILIIVTAKRHRRLAYLIIISYLLSGIAAQLLKTFIPAPRPAVFFHEHHINYYLDTFAHSRIGWRSFPSGHSASAFALAAVLSLYTRRKTVCVFSIAIALCTAYSRIYLGHHFLTDVLGGITVGVLCAVLSFLWYKPIKRTIIKPIKNTLSGKGLRNAPGTSMTTDV
ncbi:phosphatase PAP2 family protein [Flavobacterium sp. RNTU_13]|uniref:phosphatase PAP2 family protein n=1 Tax=Flavobacterium sp. RNTU_13 TaxID=3375145 RepID=UPI00398631CE